MELRGQLSLQIQALIRELFDVDVDIALTIPEVQFGDFSTNVAMQLAPKIEKNPREVAEQIVEKLLEHDIQSSVAGPGFINIIVTDGQLWEATDKRNVATFMGKTFVVEYSCPNYFKELHAGHLYQTIVGDVIARLIERSGARVHRTNFGGDVGPHVAKALWAILEDLGGEYPEKLSHVERHHRANYISARYVEGSTAYDGEEDKKAQIEDLNKRIYQIHKHGDFTSSLAEVYFMCREWSREYFVELYQSLQVSEFEKYYPESSTEQRGTAEVQSRVGTVFKESDGAIVFEGEAYGLHTRVFITRDQLPTYEAKDLGLILMEMEDFAFDHRILITGREQSEYMKVVWRAADQIVPGIEAKMTHLTNGLIKFADGQKMSSRSGNVTTAMDVLQAVRVAVGDSGDSERDEGIYLGALKYEFLKHRLGGDIAFDPNESVSLQGNSGPYLQYALVRARSILTKSSAQPTRAGELEPGERSLVRKLAEYQSILEVATCNFETHTLCNYLYDLAVEFNKFYEKNRIIDDNRESLRLAIVSSYASTLENGLSLLGIYTPEKM
jgi:arginyl-tRNA synthetase